MQMIQRNFPKFLLRILFSAQMHPRSSIYLVQFISALILLLTSFFVILFVTKFLKLNTYSILFVHRNHNGVSSSVFTLNTTLTRKVLFFSAFRLIFGCKRVGRLRRSRVDEIESLASQDQIVFHDTLFR